LSTARHKTNQLIALAHYLPPFSECGSTDTSVVELSS